MGSHPSWVRASIALGLLLAAASSCASARLPRPIGPANLAAPAAPDSGTLVVEAMTVEAPPAPATPIRLPSAVADAVTLAGTSEVAVPDAPVPAWDPLPSYVDQFTGTGWVSRPLFTGARSATARARGAWAPRLVAPYGYGYSVAPPARASSPHFSSPPSYSGY